MKNIRRALLSVSDKTDLIPFAKALVEAGVEIISTGGTAKKLRENGLPIVKDVSEYTGFPEMLDGRVKTLHPRVHGGLLFVRGNPEHEAAAKKHNILPIDLVVVNLYPFEQTVAKPGATLHDAIENIDIGGPAMLRSAAKNHEHVVVICNPADYAPVLKELEQTGDVSKEHRLELAQKVYELMARYDGAIGAYLGTQTGILTNHLHLFNGVALAYAENRCQNPARLFSGGRLDPLAITKFKIVSGNPSFIAVADASQLVSIMRLMAETFRRLKGIVPYIAIVGKHSNPCGAGISWDNQAEALNKALMGDSMAVKGGELITNFPISYYNAQEACYADKAKIGRERWELDEILAPAISLEAISILGKKAKRRLLVNSGLSDPPFPNEEWAYSQLPDGDWLEQRLPRFVLAPDQIVSWTGTLLQDEHLDDLIIAFACCWRASSNTVALAKGGQLIGLGCGQQDRIACVRLCLDRANRSDHDTKGSVFASDAFFPFASSAPCKDGIITQLADSYYRLRPCLEQASSEEERIKLLAEFAGSISRADRREGPQLLADAGCIGGVVPADGKNLAEVIEFFGQAGMSVAFVAPENRGFARHGAS